MDVMMKTILELLYGSVVRISEALTVKKTDIDFSLRCVTIFESKTQKERRVPVTEAFIASLAFYYEEAFEVLVRKADRDALWVFPQGKGTTVRCRLNSILERETSRLGFEKITSHSMRHMAATHLLKRGAGIRHVQAFLGHANICSTQAYTRVCKDDLKNVLETFHPVEVPDVD